MEKKMPEKPMPIKVGMSKDHQEMMKEAMAVKRKIKRRESKAFTKK